ncbi:MAG: cyclic nucleotide-binding domain-containing protein [Planctomycetes bacterium]|nr:cyclic nucleotide-binding domain-containing protein [Planctomycetota bacterium]
MAATAETAAPSSLYGALVDRLGAPPTTRADLWRRLAERTDLSLSRPRHAALVVESALARRDGTPFLVLRSPTTGRYLTVEAEMIPIWRSMDGRRTVRELLAVGTRETGAMPVDGVAAFLTELAAGGYLEGGGRKVWETLARRQHKGRWTRRVRDLRDTLFERTIPLPAVGALPAALGRVLGGALRRGALWWAAAPVIAAGLVLFVQSVTSTKVNLFKTADDYLLGIISYFLVKMLLHFLGEVLGGAALASLGRVTPGALFFNWGLPALIIDTGEMELVGRSHRLSLLRAKCLGDVAIGSISFLLFFALRHWQESAPAVAAAGSSGHVVADLALKLGVMGFFTAIMRLNPLQATDGCRMLSEWVEAPDLRRRSFAFLQRELVRKWRQREAWTPRERLYLWYGVVSVAWVGLLSWLVVAIGQQRIAEIATDFTDERHQPGILLFAALIAIYLLPVALMVVVFLLLLLREGLRTAAWFLFWARLSTVTLVLAAAALAPPLALRLPGLNGAAFLGPALSVSGMVGASVAALTLARYLTRAAYARGVRLWAVAFACWAASDLALARVGSGVDRPGWRLAGEGLAALGALLFAAGGLRFFSHFLHTVLLPGQRHLSWLLLALAAPAAAAPVALFFLGPPALAGQGAGAPTLVLFQAAAAGGVLLGVVLMFPALRALGFSVFGRAWAITAAGFALVAGALGGRHAALVAGFAAPPGGWAVESGALVTLAGLSLLLLVNLRLRGKAEAAEAERSGDDKVTLFRGYSKMLFAVLENLRTLCGRAVYDTLIRRLGAFTVAEFGDRAGGAPRDPAAERESILETAARCRKMFTYLEREMLLLTGTHFVNRIFTNVYDRLYWEERELLQYYVFKDLEWARRFAQTHEMSRARGDMRAFLSQVPILSQLDEPELDRLMERIRVRHLRPGDAAIRQGEIGHELFIIEEGALIVSRDVEGRVQPVTALRRGDFFGESALRQAVPRTATVRADSPARLIVLHRNDFRDIDAGRLAIQRKVTEKLDVLDLLLRMPLLAEFNTAHLVEIAERLEHRAYAPGDVIIRQGDIGDRFYIIESGTVRIDLTEAGQTRVIDRLSRGEYFGEIALMQSVPRTASCAAESQVSCLTLDAATFGGYLCNYFAASHHLTQFSSRRLDRTLRVASLLRAGNEAPEAAAALFGRS